MTDLSFAPAVAPLAPEQRRAALEGVARAHRRLIDELSTLTDDQARAASALPGWTVGHVLTHIARNADSFVGIVDGVLAGDVRDQYPGGNEQRAAGIEEGAGRSAAELVADVRGASEALEARWDQLSEAQWASGRGRMVRFPDIPVSYLVIARWREVEIHRTDLGLGATWADLDPDYVALELPRALALLHAAMAGDGTDPALPTALVATLYGRREGPIDLPAVL